jgi:hypothetical protein
MFFCQASFWGPSHVPRLRLSHGRLFRDEISSCTIKTLELRHSQSLIRFFIVVPVVAPKGICILLLLAIETALNVQLINLRSQVFLTRTRYCTDCKNIMFYRMS